MTEIAALQDKFDATEASMNNYLIDLHEEIELILNAVLARRNLFFYGLPGIAKTYTFRTFHDHLDCPPGAFYERLLDAFTTKGDLVGPIDIKALEEDGIQRHRTEGTMVGAHLVVLDEIFKANGALLNSLLKIMNEREFDNGNIVERSPLISVFGASNEFAADDSLAALSDRLHFWKIVKAPAESSSFIRMLRTRELPPPTKTLSLDDILVAQKEVDQVEITDEVYEALDHLRGTLRNDDIHPTPRRFASMIPAIQAAAWRRGAGIADIDDMQIIRHGLWSHPEQVDKVTEHVLSLASPMEKEAAELMASVESFAEDLHAVMNEMDTQHARSVGAIELDTKLAEALSDCKKLRARLAAAGKKTTTVDLAERRIEGILKTVLTTFFDFNEEDLNE